MKQLMIAIVALVPACAVDTSTSTTADDLDSIGGHGQGEPAGVHWARGAAPPRTAAASSPNLVYHGGPVMATGAVVQPIYWGAKWSNATFVGDKITGLQSFYAGMGGTSYDGTSSEYTQTSGAHVGSGVTLGATHIDTSTAPKSGNRTSTILTEVCKVITSPVTNGYYPVYIDNPRGNAGFCAWHSTGTCNGVQVQFAFFFNLDGDAGCDPGTTGGHSQGLSALANVTGHELSETLTDPHLDGWFDASGAENADKCAWTFGTNLLRFSNSTSWRIQGNWSNAAFNAGAGYGGNIGCLDGTN
jgi:hypothetical protein